MQNKLTHQTGKGFSPSVRRDSIPSETASQDPAGKRGHRCDSRTDALSFVVAKGSGRLSAGKRGTGTAPAAASHRAAGRSSALPPGVYDPIRAFAKAAAAARSSALGLPL